MSRDKRDKSMARLLALIPGTRKEKTAYKKWYKKNKAALCQYKVKTNWRVVYDL